MRHESGDIKNRSRTKNLGFKVEMCRRSKNPRGWKNQWRCQGWFEDGATSKMDGLKNWW